MGNGEEEASRDCERGIEATRRDGRTGVGGRAAGRVGRMEDWAVDLGRV
jgi:hypothetical protein